MSSVPFLLCVLAAAPIDEARSHLDHGRYAEAIEAYASAKDAGAPRAAAALGISRALIETGRYDEAAGLLDESITAEPEDPLLPARRGALRMIRGNFSEALEDAEASLKRDPENPAARLVKADALAELGRIEEAANEYRWFVRLYNRAQPTDPDTLVLVAKGALNYARWKRVNAIFHFVIGELCPDIARAAPDDWRADALSGALLLEKYNESQGVPDLEKALAKNPNAADAYVALAEAAVGDRDFGEAAKRLDAALGVNPRHVAALGLKADLALAEGRLDEVRAPLDAALLVNPHDQEILARVAAFEILSGRVDSQEYSTALAAVKMADAEAIDAATEFGRIVADLIERNAKPGKFLNRLAATLESRRMYDEAEAAYQAASEVMPELPGPPVALGLLAMRAGDVGRSKAILDTAFKADPFHVRVNNMRKVIGLLEEYENLETEHFTVRFDPAKDRVLAELAAEHLESIYGEVTGEFGFEPPGKTVVELYHTGKGQSGHEWFSARMVGLPWLQTVDASTGLMVALAVPPRGREYNWARVVRHEFVHVVTLQRTNFRMPHWYAEALAVRSEPFPRPEQWDDLLRTRVPAGELRSLDELDAVFVSPETPEDWQFAYCQSLLYARFLDERFGPEVHRKLLGAYAGRLTTPEAFVDATGTGLAEFEAGYREMLRSLAESLGPRVQENELTEEVRTLLKDATTAVRRRNVAEAISMLESALDRDSPQPQVLEQLGKLKLREGDAAGAAECFALGRAKFPQRRKWVKFEAAALMKGGDSPRLKAALEEVAAFDPDDALAAKRLAELSAEAGDAAAAERWALRALAVTPNDEELHLTLAKACESLGETDRAAKARRHAALAGRLDAADVDGESE